MSEVYINFWRKPKQVPAFTEMELALMEGGHSIEKEKSKTYSFIKSITEPTLGPLVATEKGVRAIELLRDSEPCIK